MDTHQFISHLEKQAYFERRLEIARWVKPPLPRFLYKYRAVEYDDPVAIDRLRDLLVRSRFWLSSSDDFNDPFDMSAKFLIGKGGLAKRKRFEKLAKMVGLKRREREKFVRVSMSTPHNKLEDRFRFIFEKNVSETGVYSFAGDPRSILMWSHYAKNHTGICIQFEMAQDIGNLSKAIPVEYTVNYPEVDWLTDFKESLTAVMLSKHEGWKYEREERIVMPRQARKYIRFKSIALRSIIFGCRATRKEKDAIAGLLKERASLKLNPVYLYQAKQHKSEYKLVIQSDA